MIMSLFVWKQLKVLVWKISSCCFGTWACPRRNWRLLVDETDGTRSPMKIIKTITASNPKLSCQGTKLFFLFAVYLRHIHVDKLIFLSDGLPVGIIFLLFQESLPGIGWVERSFIVMKWIVPCHNGARTKALRHEVTSTPRQFPLKNQASFSSPPHPHWNCHQHK